MSPSRSSTRQAGRALARDREHRRRAVDPDHPLAGLARDRDRDAAAADRELDDRLGGLAGELDVPRDVVCHVGGPGVVVVGEGVVVGHTGIVLAMQQRLHRFTQPRLDAGAPAR